ncbi:hypothetical protein C7S18_08290 [Ahniella affigens]|uniref:Response regulatory domain-containing protein n=1 Tax=Ahniella affigens TaxID=2021234 RepID=A0A2P1PQR5_9GAMM|nr:response regulator [Ahniella affigens]AVP97193.1 hypothetical protein C7S18_08290 [Ahniella affigens]
MNRPIILFVDDEDRNTVRYREQLLSLGQVAHLNSADKALGYFGDDEKLKHLSLVVLDLAMYTGQSMSEKDTGYGRITGEALRKTLRRRWRGPVIVLSNSPDEVIRRMVEDDGDVFRRKPLTTPIELRELAEACLAANRP